MKNNYIAIIADIKNSKKIKNRNDVQEKLKIILKKINTNYKNDIASNFTITLGDEFQGLLNNGCNVLDIIDYIQKELYPINIRVGIGIGSITTSINKNIAIGADGPAYYNAREAIKTIVLNEKKNSTFASDIILNDSTNDSNILMINTILELMSSIKNKRSTAQNKVINKFSNDMTQKELASKLKIDQSTVQRALINGSYYEYNNAFINLKKILKEVGK